MFPKSKILWKSKPFLFLFFVTLKQTYLVEKPHLSQHLATFRILCYPTKNYMFGWKNINLFLLLVLPKTLWGCYVLYIIIMCKSKMSKNLKTFGLKTYLAPTTRKCGSLPLGDCPWPILVLLGTDSLFCRLSVSMSLPPVI